MKDQVVNAALDTPDDGVKLPEPSRRARGRPKDLVLQEQVNKFLAMKPGQSFFLEGAKRDDLRGLRKKILEAGARIMSVEVSCDEIFEVAGVRSWRLEGKYDEL